MNGLVKPTVVLGVICLITTAALAFTQGVTGPIIEENSRKAADAARIQVLPEADSFTQVEAELPDGAVDAYAANNGAGYVITTQANGYGGPIQVMMGIDMDGKLTAVTVLSNSETQGLGSKVAEEPFLSQFPGMDSAGLENMDKISGSTISSNAMQTAIGIGFQVYGQVSGNEVTVIDNTPALEEYQSQINEIAGEGTPEAVTADGVAAAYSINDSYAFLVNGTGFQSEMFVLVVVGPDGSISGVRLLKNNETAGIGSQVGESAFTDQFVGQTSGEAVENISGATLSSEGMKAAVDTAMTAYNAVKGA